MIQITKEGDDGIENLFSGWLERVRGVSWNRSGLHGWNLFSSLGTLIGIRDTVLLEWF